ncbi:flagellar motor protein MotB [Azonexus sp.]|uniref:flagellar motor protein MotB n=1 Tax=Azonexus sp. TaxID=1872668 RepID=UPI0039E5834A
MADDTRPIVIKRKKVVAGGAHGGAWKIAYADFVTAMMAFFLLMWLLGSTSKGDLQGIADYFQNPMKVAMQGGEGTGDATSILKGGGQDLTRQAGQVKKGEVEAKRTTFSKEAQLEFQRQERERLEKLKSDIEKMIEQTPQLLQFKKQLLLDITSEGLRIQIVDEQNRPMFDLGGDQVKPYARDLLRQIGKLLNGVSNRVSLAGHTDAAPFSGGIQGFSNWELSTNRANASRRELVAGSLEAHKVIRVVGLGSTVLFDKNDPLNPVNRRISIVVLNQRTERAILNEEGPASDAGEDEVPYVPGLPAPEIR